MPLGELSIPSYLEPPTQAQRDALQMQMDQIKDRAYQTMQRRVAMAKTMGDAAQMQATGIDQETARQQSILNNAGDLFQDDPEGMNKITTQIQSALTRKRAVQSYKDEVAAGIARGDEPSTAAARAWAKYGPDISLAGFAPMLSRDITSQRSADVRREAIAARLEETQARDQRIREEKALDRQFKTEMFDKSDATKREIADRQQTALEEHRQVTEAQGAKKLTLEEQRLERPTAAEQKQMIAADQEVKDAERALKSHLAITPHWWQKSDWEKKKTRLEADVEDAKASRAALGRTKPQEDTGSEFQSIGDFKVRIKK